MDDVIVTFTVPGKVQCDHRPKTAIRSGKVRTYMAADYTAWKTLCGWVALANRPARWPLDAHYALSVTVHAPTLRAYDLSNAIKGIEDGCNGVLWNDDSQIWKLRDIDHGEVRRTAPCVIVSIEVMT